MTTSRGPLRDGAARHLMVYDWQHAATCCLAVYLFTLVPQSWFTECEGSTVAGPGQSASGSALRKIAAAHTPRKTGSSGYGVWPVRLELRGGGAADGIPIGARSIMEQKSAAVAARALARQKRRCSLCTAQPPEKKHGPRNKHLPPLLCRLRRRKLQLMTKRALQAVST